jgi:hypothetical protein
MLVSDVDDAKLEIHANELGDPVVGEIHDALTATFADVSHCAWGDYLDVRRETGTRCSWSASMRRPTGACVEERSGAGQSTDPVVGSARSAFAATVASTTAQMVSMAGCWS